MVLDFGGGYTKFEGLGTVKWNIENNAGLVKDNHPKANGTWCVALADCTVLQWEQHMPTKAIPNDPRTNVPKMQSMPDNGTTDLRDFIDHSTDSELKDA
eukprot:12200915-Ditylum_brightwellii.AAC.1